MVVRLKILLNGSILSNNNNQHGTISGFCSIISKSRKESVKKHASSQKTLETGTATGTREIDKGPTSDKKVKLYKATADKSGDDRRVAVRGSGESAGTDAGHAMESNDPPTEQKTNITSTVPLISVIMTTYNCASYLSHAIHSIQKQTVPNWELIVIDDSSSDMSDSILRQFASIDDRIVYFRNPVNVGCYVSKNIGMMHARGTWITFQDADDYSLSKRFELQLRACQQNRGECCYVRFLSRSSNTWSWAPITMFMRRSTMHASVGYFDCVRFGADSEMYERLKAQGIRMHVTEEYLYACTDKWLEIDNKHYVSPNLQKQRRLSLTGNMNNTAIRIAYRELYLSSIHATKSVDLYYAFPPSYTTHPLKSDIQNSDPKADSIFFPNMEHISWLYQSHQSAIDN
jgi:glycosyltransferase involved in cell wall biosynthesis